MAGGIGSRFWPMSKTTFPKQFHDILGTGQSLLQMTFKRLVHLIPEDQIIIVTNTRYKELVLKQLPQIKAEQVLCEPFMRNTAPCIAYANYHIQARCADARIVVAPSDHLITDEKSFLDTLELAIEQTASTSNLITLGIEPNRPDTGYGYIQYEDDTSNPNERIKDVRTFTEKPTLEIAQQFLDSGDFCWNSGIFIWSLTNIQNAFQKHLPDMYALFEAKKSEFGTPKENDAIEEIYSDCEIISIDYGIMEKAKNVNVVLSDFGWSDLGTWGSLYEQLPQDDQGNGVVGDHIMAFQSANNIIHAQDDKLVVLQGISDCIVVQTDDVLLICKKSDEQKIKSVVNEIRIHYAGKFI
jgi:mannose-1-phosphate guanylyltransferase